jgi:Flp pilus assembly protein TadB
MRRSLRPRPVSGNALQQHEFIEAIAVFTEQLRDAIMSSSGLEQAIAVAAETSSELIRPQVNRLVAELRYGRVEESLRSFADDLGHPTSDFVVAALLVAVRNETRDLGALLTQLSDAAREECRLHLRVWVSRARMRSSVRIITSCVVGFVTLLLLFDPLYLAVYATREGIIMGAVVTAGFASGLIALNRMSATQDSRRLLAV